MQEHSKNPSAQSETSSPKESSLPGQETQVDQIAKYFKATLLEQVRKHPDASSWSLRITFQGRETAKALEKAFSNLDEGPEWNVHYYEDIYSVHMPGLWITQNRGPNSGMSLEQAGETEKKLIEAMRSHEFGKGLGLIISSALNLAQYLEDAGVQATVGLGNPIGKGECYYLTVGIHPMGEEAAKHAAATVSPKKYHGIPVETKYIANE